jgi:LysM repeat protein
MPHNRLTAVALLLFLCLGIAVGAPAQAQDGGNLLTDPSFQNPSVWKVVASDPGSGTVFSVAPDWNGWFTEAPRTQPWQNLIPNGYPHNETGAGFTRSGGRAQEISRGSATFTAAVYQTVAVPEGSNVVGSAWVRMNLDLNSNPNARARVGIHPSGGTNPFASEIVWSSWATDTVNAFEQLTVNATATGPTVTIFLYATQSFPSDPNGVYWDDASVTIGGPGGSVPGTGDGNGQPQAPANTPVPTAPPSAAFVQPQEPQPDGSIVHVVQEGHTLAAIAVAYGMRSSEIAELNNLTNIRILQVGQRLVIRPADGNGDEAEEVDAPAAAVAPENEADEAEPADEAEEVEEEPTLTPTPMPTSTPAPPAPVAVADASLEQDLTSMASAVCVLMYEDVNMNRVQEPGDPLLAGGTISLRRDGADVDSVATDSSPDPLCFSELEPGEYVAVASPPGGYGLTTPDQLRLRLQTGETPNVAFGAAAGVEAAQPPPADVSADMVEEAAADTSTDESNQLLQNIGLIVFGLAALTLVGGLGLTLLLRRR